MKKLVIVFMLCLLGALHAETRIVSLTDARRIADSNAAILWGGNLGSAEPIPYYGPDDKIIAYHFNYAIGRPFPDKHSLQQRSGEALSSGNRDLGWGVGEFGNMVIGANRNMPVFVEYSKCLSQQYAYAQKLEEAASREFPKGYELTKTYYLGLVDVWYRINDGNETKYINLEPYTKVKTETEFREMIKDKIFFWERDSFEEEWEYLLDNGNTMSRAEVMIPGEELMPYYEWNYGCTPTSGAMLFAWWDAYKGYGKLIKHHSTKWDPVVGRYTHHVPDIQGILANTMDTGSDGTTYSWDICDGMVDAASIVGYNCESDGLWALHHTVATLFNGIRNSIDSGYPILVDTWSHTMCAVGYGTWPSMVLVHDPNLPAIRFLSRSSLWRYYWADFEPLNDFHSAELNFPNGGTQWENNFGGETLISGIYYDITWSSTLSPNAYAKIYYHDEGGSTSNRWFPITLYTPNDGHYRWLVPTIQGCMYGINTDYARVKIEIYDNNTHQLLAADGSYGNLKIKGDYVMPWLNAAGTNINTSKIYTRINHSTNNNWGLIAFRGSNSNIDIELYQSPDFYNQLYTSQSPSSLNYMLINNFQQTPNAYGVKFATDVSSFQGSAAFVTSNASQISPYITYNYDWGNTDIAKVYQVYLTPGQYSITMHRIAGFMDLDIALYAPGSGVYTYNQAVAYSNNYGTVDDVIVYRVTTAGYYALVVSCSSEHNGEYSILIENAGKWLGTVSNNWFNPANWVGNTVPNLTNDVVIPPDCPNYPILWSGTYPEIKSIRIESNAFLTIGATEMNVHQSMQVYGTINMTSNSSVLSVGENLYWGAGSSLVGSIYNYQIVCYKNWDFGLGSNIQMTSGTVVFWGDEDSYVTTSSATSRFNNVTINKQYTLTGRSVIHSGNSSNDWRVNGNLLISSSYSTLRSDSEKKIILLNPITNNGYIELDNGTLELTASCSLPYLSTGNYLNNLVISTNAVNALPSNYKIVGNLTINSGGIDANTRTITLSGNFINNVGPSGFVKGTSTVIFNGYGDQRCTNGNFHRMEVNKTTGNVKFTGTGAISNVDIYDWTTGGIEVNQGALTIFDLADNGLYGTYKMTGGTLNVNQDNSQYTDLNGSLYIYSGTMNVYGGNGNSYWPYAANAHIEMHGGVLDFKNRGIYVYNSPVFSLTTELFGGRIRTAGSFLCYRPDFQPAGEYYLELYGSTDANIYLHSSASVHSVIFNKGSNRSEACPPGLDLIRRDGVDFPAELRNSENDLTRINQVNLISNVYIFGDLIIESGTVNLNSYTLTTESDTDVINGTILMNQASARLVTYGRFQWGENATLNVTAGEMHFYYHLTIAENSVFQMGSATTARFWTEFSKIINYGANCQFGYVVLEDGCELEILDFQPVTITSGLILQGESILQVNGVLNVIGYVVVYEYANIYIRANTTIDYYINLYGVLTIDNSTLTCHSYLYNIGGSLVLNNNGSCILDRAFDSTYHQMDGVYIINSGVFEVTNNGVQFTNDSYVTMYGGTLRTGWNFWATIANRFNPAGGSVEFIGDRNASLWCNNGNYFHNLIFSKPGTRSVGINTDLQINGDLIHQSGYSAMNGYNIHIMRDVIIHAGRMGASSTDLTDIYVGRNWIKNGGSFVAGTNSLNGCTVHLISAGENAVLSTESFYNLHINKQNAVGNIVSLQPSATVQVNGALDIERGKLNVLSNSILDVNNHLTIMPGGGLRLSDTYTGGTLKLAGNFTDQNTTMAGGDGFQALDDCLVILDGTADQYLTANYPWLQFYHLSVDKSSGRVMPNSNVTIARELHLVRGEWHYGQQNVELAIGTDLVVEAAASFNYFTGCVRFESWRDSNITILGTANMAAIRIDKGGFNFNLTGNTVIGGEPEISLYSGIINLNGHTLQLDAGRIYIGSAVSTVFLQAGSVLSLGNDFVVEVVNGGRFVTLGTEANPALVTSHNGYYIFIVFDNGKIGGSWGIYEKMSAEGIWFEQASSPVDNTYPWTYPTFRNGAPGGSLLTFDGDNVSNIVIQNPIFPANTWGSIYNVEKFSSIGSVTLQNATGAFAGAVFESDMYNTVHWTYVLQPPQNFKVQVINNELVFSWDAVPNVNGYNLYYCSDPDFSSSPVGTVSDGVADTFFSTPLIWFPEPYMFFRVTAFQD